MVTELSAPISVIFSENIDVGNMAISLAFSLSIIDQCFSDCDWCKPSSQILQSL